MPPKYVTLIRHGEGFHNLNDNNDLRDPDLTPTGIDQCNELNKNFSNHPSPPPGLLVSSPLTRTLQTTLIGFSTYLSNHPEAKIVPLALLQETSDYPCDIGRPVEQLKKDFGGKGRLTGPQLGNLEDKDEGVLSRIAWELLDPVFPRKEGIYAGEFKVLEERARLARKWLWERNEEHVVAVLHGGFLHYMTQEWSDHNPVRGTGWYNAEFRVYDFEPVPENQSEETWQYSIKELDWSKQLYEEKPLSTTEEREYQETVGKKHGDPLVEARN